jgi:hypothetical protein
LGLQVVNYHFGRHGNEGKGKIKKKNFFKKKKATKVKAKLKKKNLKKKKLGVGELNRKSCVYLNNILSRDA